MKLLLASGKSFFLSIKSFRLFITKNILQIHISILAYIFNDFTLYTTFKVS